tara:strand:- start:5677 stop:6654 length:978 start_codon:yes stop_codon:yes gene_type:complete
MAQYAVTQSTTTWALVFLMVQSSDHITALTGASPTVTLSKNGGAFASPAGAVTEIASGWYKVAGNATDTNTLGPLILHATAASGDPVDMVFEIVAYAPQSTALGLSLAKTTNITGFNDIAATDIVSAGAITTSSGKVSGVILTDTLTTYTGNTVQTGDAYARIGAAGAGLTALGDTRIANLDTTVSSRLAPAGTLAVVTTVTNLTNAPTAGDFTATMKTSLNAATPASVTGAVGSVTGNVGGNVVGSVASVTAAVTVDGTSTLTEAYAGKGAAFTLASALYGLNQQFGERSTSGTTITVKQRDQSTTAQTFTIDNAVTTTSITQA